MTKIKFFNEIESKKERNDIIKSTILNIRFSFQIKEQTRTMLNNFESTSLIDKKKIEKFKRRIDQNIMEQSVFGSLLDFLSDNIEKELESNELIDKTLLKNF